jgi:hypothetical protein
VKIRKIVQKTFRGDDRNVAGALNAAIVANVNEPAGSHTHVSSRQRIVHRSGRTGIDEEKATRRSTGSQGPQAGKEERHDRDT